MRLHLVLLVFAVAAHVVRGVVALMGASAGSLAVALAHMPAHDVDFNAMDTMSAPAQSQRQGLPHATVKRGKIPGGVGTPRHFSGSHRAGSLHYLRHLH